MEYIRKVLPKALSNQKELIKTTSICNIYNEKDITRFEYTDKKYVNNVINGLKLLKHPNILNLIKYDTDKHKLYIKTNKVFPFLNLIKKDSSLKNFLFKYHAMNVLANVIQFLKVCKLCHNKISFESLFVDENGTIVLGMFEECKNEHNENDEYLFLKMIEEFKKDAKNLDIRNEKNNNVYIEYSFPKIKNDIDEKKKKENDDLVKFIESLNNISNLKEIVSRIVNSRYNDLKEFVSKNKDLYERNIYFKFESVLRYFKILTTTKKELFLDFITQTSELWNEVFTEKIFNLYIPELETGNKIYKNIILDTFFLTNTDSNLDRRIEILFDIPDSQVRLYLLKRLRHGEGELIKFVNNWNGKIFDNIILGVKCSDHTLKKESIKLLNVIFKSLSEKNRKETVKALCSYIKNDGEMVESMDLIIKNNEILKLSDPASGLSANTYNLLILCIENEKTRKSALDMFLEFYLCFSIQKLHVESLPFIIKFLGDKENQDKSFLIVEKIIAHLKLNKNEIADKDWGVKGLKSVFSRIQLPFSKESLKSSSKDKSKPAVEKKILKHDTEYINEDKSDSDENGWGNDTW